jgi:hypothetical protein
MAPRKRTKQLAPGDRVRAKTTRRTGTIDHVEHVDGHREYAVSYDEAPQDNFLTTPAKDGTQLPGELVEPE